MTFQFSLPLEVDTGSKEPDNHLVHHNHILLFQQARVAYLKQFGYTERNIEGFRAFIVEVACTYKNELFNQDQIEVKCRMDDIKGKVFSMSYSIEKDGIVCAHGMTKSICINPVSKEPVPVPDAFAAAVARYESKANSSTQG